MRQSQPSSAAAQPVIATSVRHRHGWLDRNGSSASTAAATKTAYSIAAGPADTTAFVIPANEHFVTGYGMDGGGLCWSPKREATDYSAPTWAPFSATERRMSSTTSVNTTPSAAETVKTSK